MQLDYNVVPAVAYPGMLADLGWKMSESFASGEASAAIPFGAAVKQKTGVGVDDQALLCIANSDKIIGVLLHAHAYAKGGLLPELNDIGVLPKAELSVCRYGRVWVKVGATVTKGDLAYFQTSTGLWRASAVGGDTIDSSQVASFRTSAAANGLAVLEFNFTVQPS